MVLLPKLTFQQLLKSSSSVKLGIFRFISRNMAEQWESEKLKFLKMSPGSKRKHYINKNFTTVNDIPTWKDYVKNYNLQPPSHTKIEIDINPTKNTELADKISIFSGDITTLEVDAVVNAANESLRGGGGVDGAIHRAAGEYLLQECITLNRCKTGDAKITGGYRLPASYIIHTVGPVGEQPELLQQCYQNCLKLMRLENLRTIAFPCISTGVYGYPNEPAAHIAAAEVRKHLEQHSATVDRIIFCLFLKKDIAIYEQILQLYFPIE